MVVTSDTPVAAIRFGTRPDQHTIRATLGTIADAGVQSPSAIVVGDVAGLDFSWFERRPLFGRTVVVTRAREQASALVARLNDPRGDGARATDDPVGAGRVRAARPRAVRLDRVHLRERCRRVLRPWSCPARARRPRAGAGAHRGDRSGDERGARPPRAAGRSRAGAVRRGVPARRVPRADNRRPTRCPGAGSARPSRDRPRRAARGSRREGLRGRRLAVYRTEPAPIDPEMLERVRARNGRRDHVHFVVHRRQLLRRGGPARPGRSPR